MPTRAFLDSNVFIFGFERPRSNSHRILEMLGEGSLLGVVTDRVVREVIRYLRRYYGKDLSSQIRDFILLTCELVLEGDIEIPGDIARLVGRKDAGALAATRQLGLSRLVSTDRDFTGIEEHKRPREFLAELGRRPSPGDE